MAARKIKRGEIWIVEFDPTGGREQQGSRPAIVFSSDLMDVETIGLAFVIPGTKTDRSKVTGKPLPNHFAIQPSQANGLKHRTFFMVEQLRSVSLERFAKKLGVLTSAEMFELEDITILLLELGPK